MVSRHGVPFLILAAMAVCAAPAHAANLTLSAPEAVNEGPWSVTATGVADTPGVLKVVVIPATETCSATPSAATATTATISGADAVSGSFTKAYTYTPPSYAVTKPGAYIVCGYVAGSPYASTASASAWTPLNLRLPSATANMAADPDPREDTATGVIVSGNSEARRSLTLAYSSSTATPCPSQPPVLLGFYGSPSGSGLTAVGSIGETVTVGPGAYSHRYTVSFPDPTEVRFCAWVGDTSATLASASRDISVRRTSATLTAHIIPAPAADGTITAIVTGTVEDARTLETSFSRTKSCMPNPDTAQTVGPGPFSVVITRAGQPAAWSACAELLDGGSSLYPVLDTDATVLADAADSLSFGKLAGALVPVVAPSAPIPAGSGLPAASPDRRPSFTWIAQPNTADIVILSDAYGNGVYTIASDGVFAMGPDGELGDRLGGTEVEHMPGAFVRYRPLIALDPGDYRWRIERRNAGSDDATSTDVQLRIIGPTLRRLLVRTYASPGRTSRHPGSTRMVIVATPYAHVHVVLRRGARRRTLVYRWDRSSAGSLSLDWTCRVAGPAQYRYEVTASDDSGHRMVRTGRFSAVSSSQCSAFRAHERELRRQAAARARDQELAWERAQAQARARDFARKRRNCSALNGTLRYLHFRDGSRALVCVGVTGALLPYNV